MALCVPRLVQTVYRYVYVQKRTNNKILYVQWVYMNKIHLENIKKIECKQNM